MGKMIPHIFRLIGQRTAAMAARINAEVDPNEIARLVMVAHERKPLRLEELLEADDLDFIHDVFGIRRHLDVATGELRDCFVPRYAARQPARTE